MKPRYRVTLTVQERQELEALTKTAKTSAKRFLYARSLLLCDASPQGPAWTVADTVKAMGVTPRTIEHPKKRFVCWQSAKVGHFGTEHTMVRRGVSDP